MKRKGFTLIELLAVIAILAIIATLLFPIVNDIIDDSEYKAYDQQYENIINAAKKWETDNNDLLVVIDENDQMHNITCYITIDRLKKEGYLERIDIIDPTDDSSMNDYVISFEYDLEQYYYGVYLREEDAQKVTWYDDFGVKQHMQACP